MTEFPLLEWSDEENRFLAMHHPFTNVMEEDIPLMDTDPGAVRAKAYDLVMNGVEMGSGSIRIHQSDVQEKMFKLLGFTKEQAWDQFGFLLGAFQYGHAAARRFCLWHRPYGDDFSAARKACATCWLSPRSKTAHA